MNSSYINSYGLMNAKLLDDVAENSPLWSVEYMLMQPNAEMSKTQITIGLYNQRPFKTGSNDDYMSPDQMLAFCYSLYINHQETELKHMWNYLKKHWMTYDNLSGKTNFKRLIQPQAIFFLASLLGKKWAMIPLMLTCLYSCWTQPDQTSGKLKTWVVIETLKMSRTKKICNWILKKRSDFKTWGACFLEYFQEEAHPIRALVKRNDLL